jgi:hypothetical protein
MLFKRTAVTAERIVVMFSLALVLGLSGCSDEESASGSSHAGPGYGVADPKLTAANPAGGPMDPFLTNGQAVLHALDAIAAKSGRPLRVTSMQADQINGLSADVQEPKNHVNVDHYVVKPDGTLSGPDPVKLTGPNGLQITAALVDQSVFDPKAIRFAHLSQMVREAIVRSKTPDARASSWQVDSLRPDGCFFIYFEAARARPYAVAHADMSIVRIGF